MPLLDHFTPPIAPRADWQSFHHRWANSIANALDQSLPERFFARVEVNVGLEAGADVTEEEELHDGINRNGSSATALQTYAPPVQMVIPAIYPAEAAIHIRDAQRGARLVAAIELVSPANKDRPDRRRSFAIKALAYLQHGIGVVVVDAVLVPRFNLHNEMIHLLELEKPYLMDGNPSTYAVGYQPVGDDDQGQIGAWPHLLKIGEPLPTVPLYLRGTGCIPLDLEATYMETRKLCRLR
jgi:Protein of unknown function (DUF4058)